MHRRGILVAAAAAMLAGCQKTTAPAGLIVGSSATGVPFSFIDPRTNRLTGAMVDIMDAVAKAAGTSAEMRTVPFAALIPSLTAHKIDVIAAAMVKTAAREKIVAFSDPVYAYGGGLVVAAAGRLAPLHLSDLRGKRVGAQVGTVFLTQLQDAGVSDVVSYDSLSDILRDLVHGRLEAGYGDAPILAYQLRVNPQPQLRSVEGFQPPAAQDVCFVLRKGDPLVTRLNAAIAQVKGGELTQILDHWKLDRGPA